jgi:hypothetical protein
MFESQGSSSNKNKQTKNVKLASFPRIFLIDNINLASSIYDETNIIVEMLKTLEDYIENFVYLNGDYNNLLKLFEDKVFYLNVKSINYDNNIHKCLICGKEMQDIFYCECINQYLSNNNNSNNNYSQHYLISFLTSKKNFDDFILEINVCLSIDYIKYKELNRCKDYTQKQIPDKTINLNDLLDYFCGEEKLTIADNYVCNSCKKNVSAYKRMEINKFPQILIIHFKRFRYETQNFGKPRISRRSDANLSNNISNFSGEKNESLIDFPVQNLDMKKFSKNNTPVNYELYAICNHVGKISSGHYTSICKHHLNYKWIEFDDKYVKPLNEPNLVSSKAYLLFYRKKIT